MVQAHFFIHIIVCFKNRLVLVVFLASLGSDCHVMETSWHAQGSTSSYKTIISFSQGGQRWRKSAAD